MQILGILSEVIPMEFSLFNNFYVLYTNVLLTDILDILIYMWCLFEMKKKWNIEGLGNQIYVDGYPRYGMLDIVTVTYVKEVWYMLVGEVIIKD